MESWKIGDFWFYALPQALLGNLKKEQAKWMFEDGELLAVTFRKLCSYTHAHPGAGYDTL
jgi:hypothetical protein